MSGPGPTQSGRDPYVQQVVAQRYRLLTRLGAGAMGAVYRALDLQTGDAVAVKLTQPGLNARQRARSLREAQALDQLDHPALVSARDHGEDRGHSYLVMDLVVGRPLDMRLAQEGVVDPLQAVRITASLARGVAHAHECGVLHRDIKPANVILRNDGSAVLVDFGLARAELEAQSLTQTGQLLGTPGFWSPEQAHGQLDQVGPRSDVYGLGATLYAMLTGVPPFQVSTMSELARAFDKAPQPPSSLRTGVSTRLDALCLRCLARKPAERMPSADALASELSSYLREASAAPATAGSRRLVWAGVSVGVALALGVGWAVSGSEGPAASTPPASPLDPLQGVRDQLASDPRGAFEELTELTRSDPGSASAWCLLARAQQELDQQAGALASVKRAIDLDPALGEAQYVLGELLLRDGEFLESEQATSRAIELGYERAEAYTQRAFCRMQRDADDEAKLDCEQALRLDADDCSACVNLSTIASGAGHYGESLELAERALACASAEPDELAGARFNRAQACLMLGRLDEAERDCDAILLEWPTNSDAHAVRYSVRYLRGRLREALEDARELEGGPNAVSTADLELLEAAIEARQGLSTPDAWYRVGLHAQHTEQRLAHGDFTRALVLDPSHLPALKSRAVTRQSLGLTLAAIADMDALERAGATEDTWFLATRGMLHCLAGEFEEAADDLRRAVELSPNDRTTLLNYATCLGRLGRYEEVLECLDRVLAEDPNFGPAHMNRGAALIEMGRFAEGIEALDRALEFNPGHPELLRSRASAQEALERAAGPDREGDE